ncbi:acyl--CoA ligase [Shewanella corallii]|uniref:Acyl--CoA ligase n=1 Tax=Shewanella corallii TaxID=560080 RepID=A0ABT0N693_9GAMM|nr:class I adenylate-forming enzyme family protein [Shewanella corallii]MCL2913968.1 acyl--CoA ligase [Shewanella corallii]
MDAIARAMEVKAQLTAPGSPFELSMTEQDGVKLPRYKNAPRSLAEVIESARRDDDACFLVYRDDRWSFKRFFQEMDALGRWMLSQGVQAGDPIAIACRNRPEWVAAFCAAARIGAVPAPLNSFGKKEELTAALNDIEPRLLVCDLDRYTRLEGDIDCRTLMVDDHMRQSGGVFHYQDLVSDHVSDVPLAIPRLNDSDPALILFTSGATSRAKAVLSSQLAVCQALFNIDYISAISAMTSPEIVQNIMAQAKAPVILTAVPLFHVSGLHAQLLTALRTGRRLVFMHKWNTQDAINTMKAEEVTQFNGAPSMVMQLLRDQEFFSDEILAGFSGLGFGGAGLPDTLVELVMDKLPKQMVGIGFGMTETNGVGSAISGDLFRMHPKSSGMISPLMEVMVADPLGDPLPPGQNGEICLRGVTLMDGYVGDDAATRDCMRDGWLHTGDLGYLDDNGFVYIVDRLKDVINRAGEKIAAAEVESCLLRHQAVREAAVFGVPDEETGEAVVAVVSVSPWESVSEQNLRLHVAAILAAYKVPSKIHILEQNLPRNPAGKLLRSQLKQAFTT